jgi:hypothetical protein
MSQQNEFWGITHGILSLIVMHLLAIIIILIVAHIMQAVYGNYSWLATVFFGLAGLFIWQLLYVIPICIWLKRNRNPFMMKGVIIGAVITGLLNGSCFLIYLR